MKRILIQSKFLIVITTILLSDPSAISYPQNQLNDCIRSAKSNKAVSESGVPESSIEGYCDCALRKILDKGKNQTRSAKKCAKDFLGNSINH